MDLKKYLNKYFGFSDFREHQEGVCEAVVSGRDVLLVMPTGAGKSLCFQLPAVVRGKRALVISPLMALMDDQVAKLNGLGLKAAGLHSGRTLEEGREIYLQYQRSELQFLFVAPERLGNPRFWEFMQREPPGLIAVDEAHCISQWGHDFRPEYRTMGGKFSEFKDVPIMALTATATQQVQEDICRQLQLRDPVSFIHGFRRKNLGIQVIRIQPSERLDRIVEILREETGPGIIYAPTRKEAEKLFEELSFKRGYNGRVGLYHAGLPADDRKRTQELFLLDQLEVLVATVAFGMGVDKPNVRYVIHNAMPGSLESYYQEIGRSGRDGLKAQNYLLFSHSDVRTQEYFHQVGYPDTALLKRILKGLESGRYDLEGLRESLKLDERLFNGALSQLRVHGAIVPLNEMEFQLTGLEWEKSYENQKRLKGKQIENVLKFVDSHECRMEKIIAHFGDLDGKGSCGLCDVCRSQKEGAFHQLSKREKAVRDLVVKNLGPKSHPVGRFYRDVVEKKGIDRNSFEHCLSELEREGLIELSYQTFRKDGTDHVFRRIKKRPQTGGRSTYHAHFGEGIIENTFEEFSQMKAMVRFKNSGLRKVLLSQLVKRGEGTR